MKTDPIIHVYTDRRYLIDFAIRKASNGADVSFVADTNREMHFVVKRDPNDADTAAKIHKSHVTGITVTYGTTTTGTITLTIVNTSSATMEDGTYYWELLYKSDQSSMVQLGFGHFQVTKSITKDTTTLPVAV